MVFFILSLIFALLAAASSVEFQHNTAKHWPHDLQSPAARSFESAFIKDGIAFTHAHFSSQFQQLDVPSPQFRCFFHNLIVRLQLKSHQIPVCAGHGLSGPHCYALAIIASLVFFYFVKYALSQSLDAHARLL